MLIAETQQIIDTNVIGTIRCCQAVLPYMRVQQHGKSLNVSSLGGRIAFPFHTSYCASKFAIEGLTECLHYEVCRFGIHVSVGVPFARAAIGSLRGWSPALAPPVAGLTVRGCRSRQPRHQSPG